MAVITREEFDSWQELAVTKALKAAIKKDLEQLQGFLVTCDLDSVRELQGRCKTCDALLSVSYEDLV